MIRHKQCVNFIFIVFNLQITIKYETLNILKVTISILSFMEYIFIVKDEKMFLFLGIVKHIMDISCYFLDTTYTPLFSQYENFLFFSVHMNKMNVKAITHNL